VNAKRSEANQQIRDMLKEKKVQKEAEIQHSRATAAQQRRAKDVSRSERERLARLTAIDELRRKREQKQVEQRRKAEQEMVYLEASGKVNKQPLKGRAISGKATGKQRSNPTTSNTALARKQAQQVNKKMPNDIPQSTGKVSKSADKLSDERLSGQSYGAEDPLPAGPGSSTERSVNYSTLDDALKLLEAEPEPLVDPETMSQRTSSLPDWMDGEKGLSGDKLRSIMDFLDEVERENPSPIPTELSRKSMAFEEDTQKELDAVSAVASDIASTMNNQREALEGTRKQLMVVEREMDEQRQLNMYQMQQQQKEHKHKIAMQKQEYEHRLKGLQTVIDQVCAE
jgi:hypothetical protein